MNTYENTPNRLLRLPEVLRVVGLKKSTIYEWIKNGKFPPQVRLGGNIVAWRSIDIDRWVDSRSSKYKKD